MEDHTQASLSAEAEAEAKAMFEQYRGSLVAMHKAGVLVPYKAHGISVEIEAKWYADIIDSLASQLSIMNGEAVTELEAMAKYYPSPAILERVVTFASRHISGADSLVKLVYAEKMIQLIKLMKKTITPDLLHSACKATDRTLRDLISQPLIVDEGHSLQTFHLRDKRALNLRAKNSLDQIEELLN
ncbi:hypothetical protein [Paenibacillus sp. YIM B09110]|uniref:hypothetical protein n=1 Tax=Paenibacillus sp. YIM B09110 TaxID=3126102 RepID=UPI00301BD239